MSSDLDTDRPVMPEPEEPPGHALPVVTPERVLAVLALLVPIVAMLWVGSYDKLDPEVGGVPFFYWYQLLWVAGLGRLHGRGLPADQPRREGPPGRPRRDGG